MKFAEFPRWDGGSHGIWIWPELWQLTEDKITETVLNITHYKVFENYIFKNAATSLKKTNELMSKDNYLELIPNYTPPV